MLNLLTTAHYHQEDMCNATLQGSERPLSIVLDMQDLDATSNTQAHMSKFVFASVRRIAVCHYAVMHLQCYCCLCKLLNIAWLSPVTAVTLHIPSQI